AFCRVGRVFEAHREGCDWLPGWWASKTRPTLQLFQRKTGRETPNSFGNLPRDNSTEECVSITGPTVSARADRYTGIHRNSKRTTMARQRSEPAIPACYAMVHPGLEEIAAEEIAQVLHG